MARRRGYSSAPRVRITEHCEQVSEKRAVELMVKTFPGMTAQKAKRALSIGIDISLNRHTPVYSGRGLRHRVMAGKKVWMYCWWTSH